MTRVQNQTPTFNSVWAALQETDRMLKASSADFDRRMKEAEQERKASSADFDKILKEAEQERKKSSADFDRRMKNLEQLTGSWANSHGSFAEEYFFNSFENGKQNFFGEKFDVIQKNLTHFWQGLKDEYDIVLYNHSSVAIIEVKYKAREDSVPKVLKKADTFRILFPHYKDFKIYLGLASMSFSPNVEEECIDQGIAVIKQVGDTVVINDTNLKVF